MNNPSKSVAAMTSPRARQTVSGESLARIMAAGGIETACSMISEGLTHREIAEAMGVHRGALTTWLNTPPQVDYYRLALHRSAEALMDKAEDLLRQADTTSMASIQKVKLRVEHLYRLCGIRDARYRQNASAVTISMGENTGATEPPMFTILVMPQRETLEQLIESDE